MSLLKKFKKLNNFVKDSNHYELICCKQKIGYVHKEIAKSIITNIEDITLINRSLYFKDKKPYKLSKKALEIASLLNLKKKIHSLSGELFSCKKTINSKEFFRLDRSLVEMLGIRGYGVHLIAYIRVNNSYKLWVPKRNKNKLVAPSKLDNTVAGGIKAGENIYDALKREANEEAGITSKDFSNIKLTGTINYNWKNKINSLRRDTLYIFDMEVDKNFEPICSDGEVEEFKLMDWKKVLKLIQETEIFKNNCALVFAHFLIRHGLLTNKNEKNYEEILSF